MSAAWDDLLGELEPGEQVEAVVFGPWGWDGYGEPYPSPVPLDMRGRVLTADEAMPLMQSWSFFGGYGSPDCYAVNIWTDRRVLWVTQYDGSTGLDSAPRNPIDTVPGMPGG